MGSFKIFCMSEQIIQNNEPKKHHYIPQFILRRFCDENNKVLYWDLKEKHIFHRSTKWFFMNENMYRDEKNHPDNPTFIEKEFSKFENEIAELMIDKIIDKSEVSLSRAEMEKLRIFMSLLSFRSDLRMKQYKNKAFDEQTENVLKKYQPDGNYEDLWKKELSALLNCRTYQDIDNNKAIDPIIKTDFKNLIDGYYMTVVDARGGEFILSDVYPTTEVFKINQETNLHMHELYPVSPTRMLLLNHIVFKKEVNRRDPLLDSMKEVTRIKEQLLAQPKPEYVIGPWQHTSEDLFVYKTVKIYERDLAYFNALFLNEVRNGVMFRDPSKVFESVRKFNLRDDTKIKYPELETALDQS